MFDFEDELDNRAEYAESEAITQRCPDCESEIDSSNPIIGDEYNPEDYGYCVNCYDPTPAGPEYSKGFEMNH